VSEAQKLRKLRLVQARLAGHMHAVPELTTQRDALLFELMADGVSERRIALTCGVSRGAIYKAKKRRTHDGSH